jgi:hypothetical protein
MVWLKPQIAVSFLLVLVAGGLSMPATAAIYRYVDENGRTVYAGSIPQRYVGNGYTVLNDQGQVIEVVPPAPSAAVLADRQAEEARRLQQQQAEKEQAEADNLLLRLYREPDDIIRRRDERLRQVDTQLTLVNSQLEDAVAEKEQVSMVIAGHNLRNEETPQDTQKDLEAAEKNIAEAEARIAELNESINEIIASAASDETRLRQLLALPENSGTQ